MPAPELLKSIALFRDLEPRAARLLLAVARPVSFLKGARLVRQGEPTRGAFFIRQGAVDALVALPGGDVHTVATLVEGAVFGEMALIERGVCSASVVARSNVDGWFIERDDFRALLASRDAGALAIQRAITAVLAAKLRYLNDTVRAHPAPEDRAAREPAPERDPLAAVPRSPRAAFDWRRFLPLLACFESFDPYEIEELVAQAQALELPRGAWLFSAGQPASACFIVVRGALEIFTRSDGRERRVAIAGPGELVGYMGLLSAAPHAGNARAREACCLLELPRAMFLALCNGDSGVSVSLQQALHKSLLRSIARTNTLLTRLISHARLAAATRSVAALESALHSQIWTPNPEA
jgi:CRP-like cAMP-binding protein